MTELMAHYRAATATEQAAFLTAVLDSFATGDALLGTSRQIATERPTCPACRRRIYSLVQIDVSQLENEAMFDTYESGETVLLATGANGDFHTAFWLTPCCRTAVTVPTTIDVVFG